MAQFNLSDTVDSNKVFLIKRSELEGRIDTTYNLALKKSLIKSKYPLKTLLKIHKSVSGGTPSKDIIEYWNGSIPWVSPKDIKSFYLYESQDSITELGVKNSSTKVIEPNNLLIVFRALKEGEINCTINKNAVAINQDLKALYFDETLIIDYVLILFKVLEKNIFPLITKLGTTVYSINTVEFNKLKIPVPPKYIQQQIIDLYQTAYTLKQQKEAQAKELLASIDTYLLNELGITLPEKDTSLQSRIFTAMFSEVSGGRFDSISNKSKELEDSLLNGKYSTIKLSKLIKGIKTGTTPHNSLNPYVDSGIPFLRNSNLQKGELDLSDIKFIKEELANQLTYSKKDEIIVCIAGTVGESVVNTSEVPLAINQNITALGINSKVINLNYLNYFLNTELNIELTKRLCSIATILYLNNTNLLSLNIPLPPLEKQDEIAKHIQAIRTHAKQLQEEAKAVLEEAKRGVEKMILG